ncbi:MAG: ATP-binding protein [Actinomycetota bacterium]|nr:ATP-binding protein [Actinomycetota bacterium]
MSNNQSPDEEVRKSRWEQQENRSGALKISRYTLHPDYSSLAGVREFIRTTLSPIDEARLCVGDVISATHEACKNAVIHNPDIDEPVEITCKANPELVEIEVLDKGRGFDPSLLPPSLPEDGATGGRGLYIMYSLMDKVDAETGEGGTKIRMTKRLQ